MKQSDINLARGERLRRLREAMNLTRSEFANKMGVSEHTLKSFENGAREFSEPVAREYCKRFILAGLDVNFDSLFYGNDIENSPHPEAFFDDRKLIQEEVLYFKERNHLSIIFTVSDALMSPYYSKGDIVGGQKVMNEEKFSLLENHICIVETIQGAQSLRRVLKSHQRKVTVCTLNTDQYINLPFIEELEVSSLAQVTRHWCLSNLINL